MHLFSVPDADYSCRFSRRIDPFIKLCFRPTTAVAAENLFLRKQLGLFIEQKAKPRRTTRCDPLYIGWTVLSFRLAECPHHRQTPIPLIRWQRQGFRLFWKYKSRPRGRPRIPAQLRKHVAEMASSNPTWGEKRIADELLLKIGIRISPRTVPGYMPKPPQRPGGSETTLDDICAQSCEGDHRV